MTRADEGEGREPGRPTCACGKVAFPDKIERAWSCPCGESAAWKHGDLSAAAHAQTLRHAARADARAAQAEAEVARLTQERDEALCLAEGPSTLLDLARGSVSRGMELHAAEADVARLTAALKAADYLADRYRAAFLGKPVRDLDEAETAYQSARTALEAPHAGK